MTDNQRLLKSALSIEADYLTWGVLFHALAIALRHPLNRGTSRPTQAQFFRALGRRLVDAGVLELEEYRAQLRVASVTEVDFIARDEPPCPHCEGTGCMAYDIETRRLYCGATRKTLL